MLPIIQVIAILSLILFTYIGMLAFGPPRKTLLYTAEDKQKWDQMVRQTFGSWLTSTNIIGTLTSFATVFLFFLGNASIFGWFMLMCSLTIWIGAFATNYLTSKICSDPYVTGLIDSPDQTGGVIASVFWRSSSPDARRSAQLVKWISTLNIFAAIWLEFALLADVGGTLLGVDTLKYKGLLLFVISFSVIYFVLRFGLRGFVFADIFQAPILLVATVLLLVGAIVAVNTNVSHIDYTALLKPSVNLLTIGLFCAHVFFLNTFFVVVTEPHWLRVWIFREKETTLQARSTFATAIVWVFVMAGGFAARALAPQLIGEAAVVNLVKTIAMVSPIFLAIFWFGGMAAMFTTADANIYSWLVVQGFDSNTGRLRQQNLDRIRPWLFSLAATTAFVILYYLVRYFAIPFEKLIFGIMPIGLNILPGLVQLAFGRQARPLFFYLSLIGYTGCSLIGFLQPANELMWTLAAALVPTAIALGLFAKYKLRG